MKLILSLFGGLSFIAGCAQLDRVATSPGNTPDNSDVATADEIQTYVHGVPTFEAVERSLADQGQALRWAAITVDRWDDVGLPLELHIPIIANQAGDPGQRGELQFERTATGNTIVRISTANAAVHAVSSSPEPGSMPACNLGALVSQSLCGIASSTLKACVDGTRLWQKQLFIINFYQNGRALGGETTEILFNCGQISSDPGCSNACGP